MKNLKMFKAKYNNLEIPAFGEFNNDGNGDQDETPLTFEEQCQRIEANIIRVDLFEVINQHIGLFGDNSLFVFEQEFITFKEKLAIVQRQPTSKVTTTLYKLASKEKSSIEKTQLLFVVSLTLFLTGQIEEDDFIEMKNQVLKEMKRYSARPSIDRFNIKHLFVGFYFVVQQLVWHFQNWHQLPWIANCSKLTKAMFKKLEGSYDEAWEKLIQTTLDVMQFTKTANVDEFITVQCNYK